MALRGRKRARVADEPPGAPAAEGPEGPAQPPDDTLRLLRDLHVDIDLTDGASAADDRAARYTDWAERMRSKRQRVRDLQEEHRAAAEGRSPSDPTYWTTDTLYAESQHVDDEELFDRPDPRRVSELLAVLDLGDGATAEEVGLAYRRLAKVHHPDRFVGAEPDVQEFHEERMRLINAAYRSLRDLELA